MWNLLLPALAIAGGTYLASTVNANAANTATGAINNATALQQQTDSQIAADANTMAGPGVSYLRSVVAQPNTLTPAQQTQLAELRRSTANQIHGSDFAGSGRTAAALFDKTENDFTNTALDQNRQQSLTAAEKLAGNTQVADSALEQGAAAGAKGAETIGSIDANSGIASGKLYGQAIGDVASLINRNNSASKLSSLT